MQKFLYFIEFQFKYNFQLYKLNLFSIEPLPKLNTESDEDEIEVDQVCLLFILIFKFYYI